MSSMLDEILPSQANNDYKGGRVPFYGFLFLMAVSIFRATVHFLKPDSGVNSIASIRVFEGTPDPNQIIYMFSAVGGMHQMLWVVLMGLVLWRYRNLIPLMFGFLVLECLFGFVVSTMHPLTPEFFEYTPPGKVALWPKLIFAVAMFALVIRQSMNHGAAADSAGAHPLPE